MSHHSLHFALSPNLYKPENILSPNPLLQIKAF